MGRNDEFHPRIGIDEPDEYLFVGRPRTARHENRTAGSEILHSRQPAGPVGYPPDTVEPGIPRDGDIRDAYPGEQRLRIGILYEQPTERTERPAESSPPRPEKYGIGPEYSRYYIGRYLPTGELRKVVQPKLVLDEDGHLRFHRVEKTGRIARCIGRQVENPVSPGVVPAYLVPGGRKESEEYLIRGIILPDGLHYGPALFELAERRSVEPNYPFATAHGLLQLTENVPASLIPQRGFPHERGDHLHGTGIDTDTQIIPPHLQASLIVSYTAAGMPARPHGAKV